MGMIDSTIKFLREVVLGAEPEISSLATKLPVKSFESEIMVMNSGRVAYGFVVDGPLMEKWNAEDYNNNANLFQSSLKSLPPGSVVQKLDIYFHDYQAKGIGKSFFESRYMDHFFGRPKLRHKSLLFIISPNATNKKKDDTNNMFAKTNQKDNKKDNDNISKRIDEWAKVAPQYIQEISAIEGIKFKKMDGEDMKLAYRQLMNLEFRFDPGNASRAIENKDSCLVVGEKKVNVLSLTEQSREVYNSRPNYYGVDCSFTYNINGYFQKPHIINTNYWIEDTDKKLDDLDKEKIKSNIASEAGSETGQVVADGLVELTRDMREEQKTLVSMSKNLIIWGSDEGYIERAINEAISEVRSIYDANMIIESYGNATQFFACLPGNAAENIRYLLMPSDVAVAYQDWTTTDWPMGLGDYFADRFRNPVLVPIYNSLIDSQNGIIVGPTGSGKSFFMNHLVVQRYERKERQILIDVGGTYKNNIEALGGKYFKYDAENPISFNPFLVVATKRLDRKFEYKLSEDKKQFIMSLLGQIWKKGELDGEIKSILGSWLEMYFQKEGQIIRNECLKPDDYLDVVCLNNFYYWLNEYNDSEVSVKHKEVWKDYRFTGFLLVLMPYVSGSKKTFLNSTSSLDISDELLVCFDMAGVKDDKDLYPLVTMLLVELTIDVLRKFPNDIKHFIMDEAWSMLADGMGDFVGYMYRTIRKLRGSFFIITQGTKEIVDSKVGDAIIGQSATKIILFHSDPLKIQNVGTHLGLSEQALDKIRSLRKVPDAREFFIQQEAESDVFTIEVPLEEYVLITSNPKERNHFVALKEKFSGNTERAIEEWVMDKKLNKI